VAKPFLAPASKPIIDAASAGSSIRPRGVFDRRILRNSGSRLGARVVFATAGATAFPAM
jgi:hypothetical protein